MNKTITTKKNAFEVNFFNKSIAGTKSAFNKASKGEGAQAIMNLVENAWAGFGSSFGPLILLSLFWKRMNKWGALAGIVAGALTVIAWSSFGLSDTLYEMIPGFAVSTLAIFIVSLLTAPPEQEITDQYEQFTESLTEYILLLIKEYF